MRAPIWMAIVAAAFTTNATAGDVYKCETTTGKVEFRDRPCDATHAAQKLDVKPNSAGTMTIEQVREKNAELKAKREAKRDAEDRASAAAYEANRRAYVEERAHQDALDNQKALREASAPPPGAYWDGFSRQPQKVQVEIVMKPTPPPPKPAPK